MRRALLAAAALLALAAAPAEARRARNVILFLGDAGGLPTLSAAGILAHDRPQALFIQAMPHIALSDTSSLDRWVSDSAAGMTAIVAGRKTGNGMVGVVPTADGGTVPVTSILEQAEARGLATGIVTNKPIWDATPAALYAHAAKRSSRDDILRQLLKPRFGDGVDVAIGKGRKDVDRAFGDAAAAFRTAGYALGDNPAALPAEGKAAVLRDADFAALPAVEATLAKLRRNHRGYFLMVEWDMHTDDPRAGLAHAIEMDDVIRRVSAIAGPDTLILFTADHSFGLRMRGGTRAVPFAQQYAARPQMQGDDALLSVEDGHTGEEVVVAASGPGAAAVRGFMPNTRLHGVMTDALGWPR